jgi:alkanesulfonate monooxygenase SsuD/methylene tetrahydromethanopterin reductase-like flavin-dependent oxidoreductase (luciferase family)
MFFIHFLFFLCFGNLASLDHSDSLGRPTEELENSLLFGSTDHCIEKIRAFYEAGAKRIHFWPVSDYLDQIEIFRDEIIPYY